MSIGGNHYSKWHDKIFIERTIELPGSSFAGERILSVELKIGVVGRDGAHWQAYLDAREAETLTEATGNEHEAKLT